MTKRMKMGYVEVEMQPACNLFPAGLRARGHVYHFSEIVQVRMTQRCALLDSWVYQASSRMAGALITRSMLWLVDDLTL